jgi:hypothetical protein
MILTYVRKWFWNMKEEKAKLDYCRAINEQLIILTYTRTGVRSRWSSCRNGTEYWGIISE